ncbi:Uncharacterised protein [Streptococcus pyogenes]|nr:Uncharacterised protein [Streptococcus pyogenes]
MAIPNPSALILTIFFEPVITYLVLNIVIWFFVPNAFTIDVIEVFRQIEFKLFLVVSNYLLIIFQRIDTFGNTTSQTFRDGLTNRTKFYCVVAICIDVIDNLHNFFRLGCDAKLWIVKRYNIAKLDLLHDPKILIVKCLRQVDIINLYADFRGAYVIILKIFLS